MCSGHTSGTPSCLHVCDFDGGGTPSSHRMEVERPLSTLARTWSHSTRTRRLPAAREPNIRSYAIQVLLWFPHAWVALSHVCTSHFGSFDLKQRGRRPTSTPLSHPQVWHSILCSLTAATHRIFILGVRHHRPALGICLPPLWFSACDSRLLVIPMCGFALQFSPVGMESESSLRSHIHGHSPVITALVRGFRLTSDTNVI